MSLQESFKSETLSQPWSEEYMIMGRAGEMQCCLLCRWKKGPRAKEARLPTEAGKGEEWTAPPEPSAGRQPCSPRGSAR